MLILGNLSPYLVSYMRAHSSSSLTYAQASWVFALSSSAQGLLMPISGLFLERAFGPRITCLLGFILHRFVNILLYFIWPIDAHYLMK